MVARDDPGGPDYRCVLLKVRQSEVKPRIGVGRFVLTERPLERTVVGLCPGLEKSVVGLSPGGVDQSDREWRGLYIGVAAVGGQVGDTSLGKDLLVQPGAKPRRLRISGEELHGGIRKDRRGSPLAQVSHREVLRRCGANRGDGPQGRGTEPLILIFAVNGASEHGHPQFAHEVGAFSDRCLRMFWGGHHHDVPEPLLPHHGNDGLAAQERGTDVHAHDQIKLLERPVLKRGPEDRPGVVQKEVDAAKTFDGSVDHGLNLVFEPDIALHREGFSSYFFDHPYGVAQGAPKFRVRVHRLSGDDDSTSLASEGYGYGCTDAAGGTGDESDAVLESHAGRSGLGVFTLSAEAGRMRILHHGEARRSNLTGDIMGIRRRILKKLKILGSDDVRPASRYSTATPSPSEGAKKAAPAPPPPKMMTAEEAKAQIEADVAEHKLLIFMKGTRNAPMCGFSAAVVDMFNQLGVPYETRNVLADPAVRQSIKDFTDWPTIPQIFVAHEFIGGCDITREMFESGDLKKAVVAALEG